jgi:hypothetical protein
MTVRKYSSISQETTLTSALSSGASTMVVGSSTALLSGITLTAGETFTVVIDPDTALEEIVDVISPSSTGSLTLTITRGTGVDGTSAIAHSAGAKVRHMAIGRDFREANNHIKNETTAHGLTIANVLETTDTNMITTAMLQSNAVTTVKITDLNVTTAKIADSAITSAKIADLGIATGDIADSAITTAKIANANVTTAKIEESAVTNSRIAADAVTADKIASGEVGTTEIANLAVTTGKIADSAITSAKIADGTIATADIADGAITTAKIADGTIVAGDLADGAVTSAKILNGTIVDADINASAEIDKTKISGTAVTVADTGTVTSTMIADGTIVDGDVSATAAIAKTKLNLGGTITSADLVDGTIVNADINASAAIALSKLAVDPLARTNHTGTQTASTVSDFDTQVRTSRLDQMAAPTSGVSLNSQKIINLANPVDNGDAVSLGYLTGQKGVANGIAPLDGNGKVPLDHIPATAIAEVFVVTSQAAMLALPDAHVGDIAIRTDVNKSFILRVVPATTLSNWNELLTPTDAVLSVDGLTGAVSLSGSYLNRTTGQLLGNLDANTHKVTNLGAPTSNNDAATKVYVDTVAGSTADAQAAAAAAAASYDSFDDRYLGAKSTAPTLDNDGNTLLVGAIYWNSVTNQMFAWTGSAWGSISSTADIYRFRFTAAGGETTESGPDDNGLTLSYIPGKEQVYLNGVLLARTSDYNATNGTSITGLAALAAGDILEVITFTAFELASAIARSLFDAKGDILVATSNDTPGKISVGSNGQYLQADSSTATGLTWSTVTGYSAPTLGSTSIASGATVTNINGLTINSTTIPSSVTLVSLDATQTLTNKSLTTPTLTGTVIASGDINLSGTGAVGSINDEFALILMGAL